MATIPLRLRIFAHRASLDATLAEGQDPAASPLLALRAEQLVSRDTRRAIAATIRNLVDAADEPWHGARPPLQCDGVLAARDELLSLARRLEGPGPVSVQSVALASRLVWDCASPVYAAGDFSVWEWARAVEAA